MVKLWGEWAGSSSRRHPRVVQGATAAILTPYKEQPGAGQGRHRYPTQSRHRPTTEQTQISPRTLTETSYKSFYLRVRVYNVCRAVHIRDTVQHSESAQYKK